MRTREQIAERLREYMGYQVFYSETGYIAWRCSTGENYEILLIEVSEPRKGYGRNLVREMCRRIRPYHSVFVFRRATNEVAGEFYRALGFKEIAIPGLYKTEAAVLGVASYEVLKQNLGA